MRACVNGLAYIWEHAYVRSYGMCVMNVSTYGTLRTRYSMRYVYMRADLRAGACVTRRYVQYPTRADRAASVCLEYQSARNLCMPLSRGTYVL
jgi:hypothetical protein